MDKHSSRRRARAATLALLLGTGLAGGLTGCGGGIIFGIGVGRNDPPVVNLVAGISEGNRGDPARLVADASDDDAVRRVEFWRVDENGNSTLLGSDSERPYVWDVTLPDTGPATYFARAVDSDDDTTDSARVSIALPAETAAATRGGGVAP